MLGRSALIRGIPKNPQFPSTEPIVNIRYLLIWNFFLKIRYKTNKNTICAAKETGRNRSMFLRFSVEKSNEIKEETTMQGEHTYIRMAEIVDKCDALAFFTLHMTKPGSIYMSESKTLKNAILNVTIYTSINLQQRKHKLSFEDGRYYVSSFLSK